MSYCFAALTAGAMSPSARFRVRQYIDPLQKEGILLREFSPSWRGHTLFNSRLKMLGNYIASLGRSAAHAVMSRTYDGVIVQRWAMGSFPTTEFLSGRPRVWDIDDAIWLNVPGLVARRYAASFDLVICGNEFIADHISQWNPRVVILPTAVDTNRFRPSGPRNREGTICWSGTKGNLKYLYRITEAIAAVLEKHRSARLRVVCDCPPDCRNLDRQRIDYSPWTPASEVSALQSASIGIMPLDDTEWCRGKCSYKMLCSMACGLPVVANPVGMNAEVLGSGDVGFAAIRVDEWVDALDWLLSNPGAADTMGRKGRDLVVSTYSVDCLAPRLSTVLKQLVGYDAAQQNGPGSRSA
jgi:glycosyltransferase involved in cell wall biosynthesis